MAGIQIALFPDGLRTPARLEVSLGIRRDEHGGPARFAIDWIDGAGNIAFHFNPRPEEGVVLLSSFLDGEWGPNVTVGGCPLQHEPRASHLLFEAERNGFRVSIDGRSFCEFEHRVPPETIRGVQSWRDLWRLESRRVPSRWRSGRGSAHLPEIDPTAERWASHTWVETQESEGAAPLERFRFFAVLGTWLEEDIVEAAVASALAQGCERVYLVDNGSDDATVERAVAAGATFAMQFASDDYDEEERVRRMQSVVEEVSQKEADDHVWWLWLDADEFHHGPGGIALKDYLAGLDARVRVVGSRYFNHFPDRAPACERGRHPIDFQPLSYELRLPWYCDRGHWKHALQRWDRDGPTLVGERGLHTAAAPVPLLEPAAPAFCHHFPYRERAMTERRLARLFGRESQAGVAGYGRAGRSRAGRDIDMRLRYASLDAVYRGKWGKVHFFPPCATGYAPDLEPFDVLVGPDDAGVGCW